MKPVRVIDPGHVLAVCTHAAYETGEQPPLPKIALTATEEAVTIRIAADSARVAAILLALHQAGYDAAADTAADGGSITVRGWSPARLKSRVTQLDTAVQWLTEQLAFTPRTAVAFYQMSNERPALTGRAARNRARHLVVRNLRGLIQRQTGLPTWQDPPGQPTDPRTGMLLRQCQWLEDEVDLLLSRHRAIATQAIAEHRLETESEHRGEADRAAQSAAVAAHDAPTEAGDPAAPSTSRTPPGRNACPAASPTRRGA